MTKRWLNGGKPGSNRRDQHTAGSNRGDRVTQGCATEKGTMTGSAPADLPRNQRGPHGGECRRYRGNHVTGGCPGRQWRVGRCFLSDLMAQAGPPGDYQSLPTKRPEYHESMRKNAMKREALRNAVISVSYWKQRTSRASRRVSPSASGPSGRRFKSSRPD
jgi:hypothetical protein